MLQSLREVGFDLFHFFAVLVDVEQGDAADPNLQQTVHIAINQIAHELAFEGLDGEGKSVGLRFEGSRWAAKFASLLGQSCGAIELAQAAKHLTPAVCKSYNARLGVAQPDERFWQTASKASQFRVLWNEGEVGRCAISDGVCEVKIPPA